MKPMQNQDKLATFFIALGHRRRQMLCEILAETGSKGITYGGLQMKSGLTKATLTHHLRFMGNGGIIKRRVKGRETWYSLDVSVLAAWSGMFFKSISNNRDVASAP